MNYKGSREAFIAALMDIAESRNDLMLVSADSKAAARATAFAEKYGERFFELGISEQSAVDVCAGMATCGLTPFLVTYAGFITMRACEQIRTFVAYPNLNVKLVGLNAGLIGGEREGVTHQFYEDISIARAIPNFKILCPGDENEVYEATKCMMEVQGPCYMRIGSGREDVVFEKGKTNFKFGKVNVIKNYGNDVAIFTHGFVLNRAITAADTLKNMGINVTLVEVSTINPADKTEIAEILGRCKNCITYEDHNINGGLGSLVSEIIAEEGNGAKLIRMGLNSFGESGTPDDLLAAYHLDTADIIINAKKLLK